MKRISVDFNTMMSEPIGIVKFGKVCTPNGDRLPPLHDGERVLLYDEELQVEATILYDAEARYWMARPDRSTWVDIPAPAGAASEA